MVLFKQETAYEMRISDWSSDVCSSDLVEQLGFRLVQRCVLTQALDQIRVGDVRDAEGHGIGLALSQPGVGLFLGEAFVGDIDATEFLLQLDRKRVVSGKRVSDRVDLGGRRLIKTKEQNNTVKGA